MKVLRLVPALVVAFLLQLIVVGAVGANAPDGLTHEWGPTAAAVSTNQVSALTADCPAAPTFSFEVSDGVGDAFPYFGIGPIVHDINSVAVQGDDTTVCFTLNFGDLIAPPDAPSERIMAGAVDFDLDEDRTTGAPGIVDAFCERAGLGVDASLDLFSSTGGTAILSFNDGSFVAVPVSYEEMSVTAAIPASALGDSSFNFGAIVGTFEEPTDCTPNGGSIHSSDGSIVPAPPPLELSLEIDDVGQVVAKQGVATVSGTITCSEPAQVEIFGEATQRAGRTLIRGFFSTFVECDSETEWSATFMGDNGLYAGGKLDVTAQAFAFTGSDFAEAFDQETIKLTGAKK